MSEITLQSPSDVEEPLLLMLTIRNLESQRPDALIKDENAVALVWQMDLDPSRILTKVDEESQVATILRNADR